MTSIIITTYNQYKLLKQTLESLFKYTQGNFEVIVVENASTDGTVKYLQGLEKAISNLRVIYNKENQGFVRGNNQGILMAKGEYITLCNNDLVFTPNWLLKLKRCLEQDPRIGMVGPYSNYVFSRQQIQLPQFKSREEFDKWILSFSAKEQEVDKLVFFCVLIRAELFNKENCGLLDDDLHPGNFEDDLMCWYARKAHWKLKIANCFIWHVGSQSWRKDSQAYMRLMGRNQKIFYRKTGREIRISLCMAVADSEKPETLRKNLQAIIPFVDEICLAFNYKYYPKPWRIKKLMKVVVEVEERN